MYQTYPLKGEREKLDNRINLYYAQNPGPLGSTDRKCPINLNTAHSKLNEESSELAANWAERSVTSWVGTLGRVSESFTPIIKWRLEVFGLLE